MAQLKDIIAYILQNYPVKDELSNARVTKIIFLSDWHQAINYARQLSNILWVFDSYGPFVWDIHTEVTKYPDIFDIKETINLYGQKKTMFCIKDVSYQPHLLTDEKKSLDYVIDITKKLNWESFIKLVYSTYPIMSSERYSILNLIQMAKEYKKQD